MKKLILLITINFFLITISPAQEYGWTDISSNLPEFPGDTVPRGLTDVFFVSDHEGWITTSLYGNDTSFILYTTDGGETFELQTTELSTNAIHMLNENEGYTGGTSGFVYRTTDGGGNWTHHGSIGTTLADISFPPNGDTGYCCGLNGNIHSITSEGTENMTSNVYGHLLSISFPINSDEGWVCGGDVIRHYTNSIWNGDQNMPSGGYNAIFMLNNLNGWIVGDGGIIAHTENGWNWSEQINTQENSLFAVYFLDENCGWATGSGGTIVHTTNGGANWNVVGSGLASNFLTGVHFTSSTNGYVVGNGKTLLKYTEVSGIGEKVEPLKFEIYPNPAKNKFSVQCLPAGQAGPEFCVDHYRIELFDLFGKPVVALFDGKPNSDHLEFDVGFLPAGIYLLRINSKDQNFTQKIIIQK